MYLSMANLFDRCIVDGDYLESAFRPWGGNAIHGYTSTQSVFYNTTGEAYHPQKDYIIDSRQYKWGYVIGTSGPAYRVAFDPVNGTTNGYSFDTAPRDLVEGVAEGDGLIPQSLYLDQLERRRRDTLKLNSYDVTILVMDVETRTPIPGCKVIIYDTPIITDSSGRAEFHKIPEMFIREISKDHYQRIQAKQEVIYSDTLLTLQMLRNRHEVSIVLQDERTGILFGSVSVELGGFSKVTDSQGIAQFNDILAGSTSYAFSKISFRPESGTLDIISDTTITFRLHRTHANLKIWPRDGNSPVNQALVWIGEDTITTTNLGLAKFTMLPADDTYLFGIYKEGYDMQEGELLLISDTSLTIQMQPLSTTGKLSKSKAWIECWPNPAQHVLHCRFPSESGTIPFRVTDLFGRIICYQDPTGEAVEIDLSGYAPGIYLLIPTGANSGRPVSFIVSKSLYSK
jgi:hypothetical protein